VPMSRTGHQLGAAVVGDVLHGAIHYLPSAAESLPARLARLAVPVTTERVVKVWLTIYPARIDEFESGARCY